MRLGSLIDTFAFDPQEMARNPASVAQSKEFLTKDSSVFILNFDIVLGAQGLTCAAFYRLVSSPTEMDRS